jgi:hypothetical protein
VLDVGLDVSTTVKRHEARSMLSTIANDGKPLAEGRILDE